MITKKSFAKINLYLEIVGRNKKGYHLLNSLIGFLDIYDLIKIEKSDDLSLDIEGPYSQILKDDKKENIIITAVRILSEKYDFTPNIKISLTKNIPVGAGIGGGSSNCATTLLMINEFYNLGLSLDELKKIGIKLGADVPICLHQKIALVEGIGEKISNVQFRKEPLYILLVNPNKHVSTKEIFESLGFKKNNSFILALRNFFYKIKSFKQRSNLKLIIENHCNDMELCAAQKVAQISEILTEISKQKNCIISRMSGSGATCFGVFENEKDLASAKINLQNKFGDFYIKKSKLIYDVREIE